MDSGTAWRRGGKEMVVRKEGDRARLRLGIGDFSTE